MEIEASTPAVPLLAAGRQGLARQRRAEAVRGEAGAARAAGRGAPAPVRGAAAAGGAAQEATRTAVRGAAAPRVRDGWLGLLAPARLLEEECEPPEPSAPGGRLLLRAAARWPQALRGRQVLSDGSMRKEEGPGGSAGPPPLGEPWRYHLPPPPGSGRQLSLSLRSSASSLAWSWGPLRVGR